MTSRQFGGLWTEQKLAILQEYLGRYTTVLKKQSFNLTYVDAFAGEGSYAVASDEYEEFFERRAGSTRIAIETDDRPFDSFLFIDVDSDATDSLRDMIGEYPGRQVEIVTGDANIELPKFCKLMRWNDRAVVFLDPYATSVNWSTIEVIAASAKIDCWILFPLSAVTRMMPNNREPDEKNAKRLDDIFGGRKFWQESYRDALQPSLFDQSLGRERPRGSDQIAERYRHRLSTVFHSVASTDCTLRNSKNSPLFELMFAASNPKGAPIAINLADHILKKW